MTTELKDPAIKLFGRTIPLQESQITVEAVEKSDLEIQIPPLFSEDKDRCRKTTKTDSNVSSVEDPCKADKPVLSIGKENNYQNCTKENKVMLDPKSEEDQGGNDSGDQEKLLKKPDKILPCPRCNSLETKFCYYNNYNVNQPRHFCKNCQRYWTAGGTMRNVPVGAGRRKNKHLASQYRHLMMSSDGIPTNQVDSLDSANHQLSPGAIFTPSAPLNGNGSVLRFGTEAPLCESMATVLNLGDQKRKVEVGAALSGETREEPSSCDSFTTATHREEELPKNGIQMEQGVLPACFSTINPPHPAYCYPGPPWAYPWSPGWNNVAGMAPPRCPELVCGPENGSPRPVQWGPMPMVAAPALCTPSMPFPFIPASYWGCMPGWAARSWNVPWVGSNGSISPSSSTSNSGCSSNGSPTLGKHSRDVNLQGEEKAEKCLWVPKTLRIDDPDEAAKSSIWATLGFKPDRKEPIIKGGIFKAFESKTKNKDQASDAEQVLQANPAALCRSQSFQENT